MPVAALTGQKRRIRFSATRGHQAINRSEVAAGDRTDALTGAPLLFSLEIPCPRRKTLLRANRASRYRPGLDGMIDLNTLLPPNNDIVYIVCIRSAIG